MDTSTGRLENNARATPANLFTPQRVGKLHLPNRLAVAPMTRISATADGRATG
ncbi:hypothetical protein D3C72_2376680 [compost metagenome]